MRVCENGNFAETPKLAEPLVALKLVALPGVQLLLLFLSGLAKLSAELVAQLAAKLAVHLSLRLPRTIHFEEPDAKQWYTFFVRNVRIRTCTVFLFFGHERIGGKSNHGSLEPSFSSKLLLLVCRHLVITARRDFVRRMYSRTRAHRRTGFWTA